MLIEIAPHDLQQTDPEAWKRNRGLGVGGSDMAAIIYDGGGEAWADKVLGHDRPGAFTGNRATEQGTVNEGLNLKWYSEEMGCTVEPVGLLQDSETGHYLANVDGVVCDPQGAGVFQRLDGSVARVSHLVEAKCPTTKSWAAYKAGELPVRNVAQCAWYGGLFGGVPVHLSVKMDTDLVIVPLAHDPEFFADLKAAADEFWDRVQSKTPPDNLEPSSELALLAARFPVAVREDLLLATSEQERLLAALADAKAKVKEAERNADAIEARIRAAVGDSNGLQSNDGRYRYLWGNRAGSVSYKAALEALVPNLRPQDLEKFRGRPSRSSRFTVKE